MNLEKLNVHELEVSEKQEVQGGWLWAPVAVYLAIESIADWKGTKEAIKKGWNSVPPA